MNGWVIWFLGLFVFSVWSEPATKYDNLFGVGFLLLAALFYGRFK